MNYLSLSLILISLLLLIFKGLNFGVDFKGGTLIELRVENKSVKISEVRDSFSKISLGNVTVKQFGTQTDYIVKFDKQNSNDPNFINNFRY